MDRLGLVLSWVIFVAVGSLIILFLEAIYKELKRIADRLNKGE